MALNPALEFMKFIVGVNCICTELFWVLRSPGENTKSSFIRGWSGVIEFLLILYIIMGTPMREKITPSAVYVGTVKSPTNEQRFPSKQSFKVVLSSFGV